MSSISSFQFQALRTAPLPDEGEPPRQPLHAALDEWLASLGGGGDDDDAEESEDMPAHLTSGGVAVTAYYVDERLRAWPLPLNRLVSRASPHELNVQLPGEADLQPLPDLQVREK